MPNIALILVFFTVWNFCLTEAGDGAMCRMKTKDNKSCVFPFVYRGKSYDSCVKGRANSRWCALSPSYDDDRKYGYCRGMEGLITGDDQAWVYANGKYLGNDNGRWDVPVSFYFPENLQVVAIYVKSSGGPSGLMASFANGIVTDNKWKCTTQAIRDWQTTGFDDCNWPAATIHGGNSGQLRVNRVPSNAQWIGPSYRNAGGFYCRRRMSYFGENPSVGGSCDKPLGLQSGWVKNSQIKASSIWSKTHAALRGRLHMPRQYSYPGAWIAKTNNVYQWIQVSFYRPVQITALATQGRANYNQWVKSYTLTYSEDGKKYSPYSVGGQQKVFTGNRDKNSVVKHNISPHLEARFIRLHPKTWQGHIAMRMELYGCLKVCKVDVGILMDESGSVGKDEFTKEKNFVKALAGNFQIGPNAAQFGVITYSTGSRLKITLNQYRDLASFQCGLSTIRYAGGWTHTGTALEMAYSQLFASNKGARANVAKVLIIITDGESTGGMKTLKNPIKKLKYSRVNIISIGVGRGTSKNELNFMASSPINTHVFSVNNMDQLNVLIGSITSSSCSNYNCRYVTCDYYQWSSWSASCGVAMKRTRGLSKVNEHFIKQQGGCSGLKVTCDKQETEIKTTNCPCVSVTCSWNSWGSWSSTCGKMSRQRTSKVTQSIINRPNCNGLQSTCPKPDVQSLYVSCCKGELGILMDESGSIKDEDFEEEKQFITDLANGFTNFGSNGLQMAVISYSTSADLDIKLNQYSNKLQFINAVRKIKQYRGWTYTNKALIAAKNQLFQKANGARPGVSKILVVLTDGASTGGMNSLRAPLEKLKQSYVNIFAIGIGRNINKGELQMMATEPVKEHVFYVADMQELQTLLTNIGESACKKYKCRYVTCDYSVWSSWSTSCGTGMKRKRTLSKQNEHIIEQQGGCSGLTTTCQKENVETKNSLCPCKYVTCSWNSWGGWSGTCGQMTRQRTSKVTQHVVNKPNCNGLQTTCPAPQTDSTFLSCPCKSVKCTWKPWTDWSATCGLAERTRSIQATQIVVQQPDCSGLPQTCTQPPEKETRRTMCTCQTVQCEWSDWSEWSATCGAANRTRTIQSTQITVQKENCDGLSQSCPQPPETEYRTKDCECRTVSCKWEEWSSWSTSCGTGTRMRGILETVITVNKPNCAGLPQECTEQPQQESRAVKCACPTVECKWNAWSAWSATCGTASRTRTIKTIKTTVQKLKCEGLSQSCPQPPETEQQTTNCKCKTVNCEWALWTSWSTTCGVGTRTRHIEETAIEVFKPDCSGLPQTCQEPPESDVREIKCDCQTVNCTRGEWEAWSATCGLATRKRTITTEQIVVQQPSCDGLPQSCPSGPETETRKSMCTCQSVNCTWGDWGNWSGDCDEVNRTRHIVETQTSVQAESCDGIPKKCNQEPETENNTLPECQECYTVECIYNPWSSWSATCGKAFRRRIQLIEEIELWKASCEGLPLECPGDEEEEEERNTPLCPTTIPPPTPTT